MDLQEIRKEGIYKKLKTSKKKYFILRENAPNLPACLEYYDSEKKVKPDAKPKRSVVLRTCFSINPKFDAKNAHTLVLFTQDDCLGIVFDSEQDQQDWYQAIQDLQSEAGVPASRYDHVWQVSVKPEGLANGKTMQPGTYRLCLSKKTLTLVPTNRKLNDVEFQLATIRKLAHKKTFFMMESGTAAATGAGEVWMQVEDAVVAHNIHDICLKAMRSNPGENISLFRGRSHTHGTSERPHRASTKRNSIDMGSSTLPRHQKAKSMHVSPGEFTTSPSLKRQSASPHKTGNVHNRPKSSFVDFRTVSPGQSPHIMSPLSQEMRERTDSWESRGSHRTETSSVSDECEAEHALSFSGRAAAQQSISQETSNYLTMTTPPASSKVGDVAESPEEAYMEMSSPVSSAPCLKTLAASPIMPTDSDYLDMQPLAVSLHKVTCSAPLGGDKVLTQQSDQDGMEDEFPKRTYSLGSKPQSVHPALGQSSAYMDMNSSLDKVNPKTCSAPHLFNEVAETGSPYSPLSSTNLSHSSSRSATPCGIPEDTSDLMEFHFDSKTGTGSRESLSDFRSRTSSGSSRDIGYHTSSFETEFRDRTDSSCSRDSAYRIHSMDKFRHRTQTVCQDSLRTHASNLSVEENMRPRSFSHGTSRFRELSKRIKDKTLRHTSGDNVASKLTRRFSSKNPSRESIQDQPRVSTADSEYIDINVVAASDHNSSITKGNQVKKPPEDDYMVINPEMGGDFDIMGLRGPSYVKKTQDTVGTGLVTDSTHSGSVKMRNKPHYNRKEASSKHSSSSESVSSTSSSDHVARGNKMSKPSTSSLIQGNNDYFELQPGGGSIGGGGVTVGMDTYMKFPQAQPKSQLMGGGSNSISNNNPKILPSQRAAIEDNYSIMDPRESYSGVYQEGQSASSSSEPSTLAEILQGLDKVVSPIKEEDNESMFGPKPSMLNTGGLLGDKERKGGDLKHEYVNVNYGGEERKKEQPKAGSEDTGSKGTEASLSPTKADVKPLWGTSPVSSMHEYCEINFGEKDSSTGASDTKDASVKHRKTEEKKDCDKTSAYDKFKSKSSNHGNSGGEDCNRLSGSNNNSNQKESVSSSPNTKPPTPSTPAPFELLPFVLPSDRKENDSNPSPSPSPKKDNILSVDVFNLGALPTPAKPHSDNTNPDLTPSKSPTLSGRSIGNLSTHRGSVTSITSVESISASSPQPQQQQQLPRLRSHSSNTCLSSMDKSSTDRLSYQEPSSVGSRSSDTGDAIRRQSSQVSLGSGEMMSTHQPTLNYATLDLSGSQDEASFPSVTEQQQVSPGIKSRSQAMGSKLNLTKSPLGPVSYAQIDFEQCNMSGSSVLEKEGEL